MQKLINAFNNSPLPPPPPPEITTASSELYLMPFRVLSLLNFWTSLLSAYSEMKYFTSIFQLHCCNTNICNSGNYNGKIHKLFAVTGIVVSFLIRILIL